MLENFNEDSKILESTKIDGFDEVLRKMRSKGIKSKLSIQTVEDIKHSIFDIALMETGLDRDKFNSVNSSSYGNCEYWERKLYSNIEDLGALGEYIKEYRKTKELFDDCSWNKTAIHDFEFDLDIIEDEDISTKIAIELGKELEINRDLTMFQMMIDVDKDNGTWNINFHAD